MPEYINENELEGIAIIGMAGRFPGADDIPTLWDNLCNGKESITYFRDEELDASVDPALVKNPNYVKARGVLNDVDSFDAEFFKCYPREAQVMDPQSRIFMEVVWASLENACYIPETSEAKIGIFAGKGYNEYYNNHVLGSNEVNETFGFFEAKLLNEKDFFSTLVSYKLNLTGPSININTGCSTSLVAVCQAFDSLLSYQCDIALAGGATIYCPQNEGYLYQEGKIASSDGHCRPFDSKATGTVFGSAVGIVVLKRLADAVDDGDSIYAVIKGCGLNNDGSAKMSFSAPSVDGQAEAIAMALANAEVSAEMISYIETHGTATPLGDPVEVEALSQAFREQTENKQFCAIGSIKGNIGHTDSAAGVVGLIKTALALYNKKIPPSINFTEPNPKIDFDNSPFFVNTKLREWDSDGQPRIAGVSSLGVGGTNAHVILEEAPLVESSSESRPSQLIMLSAKNKTTLDSKTRQLAEHLESNPNINIADVAYSLTIGRQEMNHRRFLVCRNIDDATKKLKQIDPSNVFTKKTERGDSPVVFMFPGQGSQYVNMGLNFYEQLSEFREIVDHCSDILLPHLNCDLRDIIYPKSDLKAAEELLKETRFQQPAMFAIEYALAKLWMAWGIQPSAMIGHSIGEYVAACLAGVFSLKDALMLVATRGRMMQDLPGGSMLSVRMTAVSIEKRLTPELSLAAVNAPSLCVVSGPADAIDKFKKALENEDIVSSLLHTSHAFHSSMMEEIIEPFTEVVRTTNPALPKLEFVSTVTGTWITSEQATNPEYWGRQLRAAVRFADGIQTLWENPDRVLLEVGPRTTATILARQQIDDISKQAAISSLSDTAEQQNEWAAILKALGNLWLSGVKVPWDKFYQSEKRVRLALPAYPFERKRFWLEPVHKLYKHCLDNDLSENRTAKEDTKNSDLEDTEPSGQNNQKEVSGSSHTAAEQLVADIWQRVLGIDKELVYDHFFRDLGGDSLSILKVIALIQKETGAYLSPEIVMLNKVDKIAEYLDDNINLSNDEAIEPVGDPAKPIKKRVPDATNLEPFYFGDPQKQLYGIYHLPAIETKRDEGVMLCYPLPQEYMSYHWAFRQLGELLSNVGFHVLRFDYFGTGDSAGESTEVNIDQWKSDILTAADELKNKHKLKKISIIGLRFGATLAFQACTDGVKVDDLILWDPVLNGKRHIKELEQIRNELKNNYMPRARKALIDSDYKELLGYPFSFEHRKSIMQIDLFHHSLPNAKRITTLATQENDEYVRLKEYLYSNGRSADYQIIKDVSSWGKLTNILDVQFPSKILHRVVSVLTTEKS